MYDGKNENQDGVIEVSAADFVPSSGGDGGVQLEELLSKIAALSQKR